MPATAPAPSSRLALGLALGWVAVASGVAAAGVLVRAPQVPFWLGVLALSVLAVGLVLGVPRLRRWAVRAPLRPLVLTHVARFVALGYVGLHGASRLPAAFAHPAAIGESAVALTAVFVALFALPPSTPKRWTALLLWNVFGATALVVGMLRAVRLGLMHVHLVAPLTEMPFVLVPLAVVPLGLAAHAVVFARLWAMRREVEGLV